MILCKSMDIHQKIDAPSEASGSIIRRRATRLVMITTVDQQAGSTPPLWDVRKGVR